MEQLARIRRLLTGWIQCIDIDAQIHRILRSHSVLDLLDNTLGAYAVDGPRLDDLEAAIPVIVIVGRTGNGRADASMDVGIISQKAFGVCVVEISPVVDGCLFGRCSAKDLGSPSVAIESSIKGGQGIKYQLTGGCQSGQQLWARTRG